MKKLIRALGSLLTILALTVSVDAGAHPVADKGMIGQARSAYYNLTSKGFKGFTATVKPNWKLILADTGTKENLKVFRAVRFSMVVDANGAVTVRHEVSANATKLNLQPFVNKIQYDVERLISGFFNIWRIFVVNSPFPETEQIKIEIGSAYPFEERKTMMIKGRDLISGIPRTLVIDDAEIREALQEPIGTIVNAIKIALENTPPELAGDIIDRGIVLTGGGSLLKGMDTRFREETNLPIITVDDPLTSVVLGVGKILDELDLLRKVSVMSQANNLR